jgi:hypothetical protein
MFRASTLLILKKGIEVLEISAVTGNGLDDWYAWLRRRMEAVA